MRASYGAGPAHLAAVLLSFAVAGTAVTIVADDPLWPWMLVWFGAAVVGHDLVLSPLAAGADRLLRATLDRLPRQRVPVVNHVRVPALAAALTFLLFLPGIVRQGEPVVRGQTGLDQAPFLGRWLLLTAAFAGASALVYVLRVLRGLPDRQQQVVDGQRQPRLGGQPRVRAR
jgi:hypothetical protein